MISQKNKLRGIKFHKSCKCDCLLNEKVCNNKQKWNKDKCRRECLKIERCSNNSFFNVVNCSCELRKAAKLVVEECKEITDDIKKITNIKENKTSFIIKKVENCKPFVTSSVLFVYVSIITTGIMIYFCSKTRNKDVLRYLNLFCKNVDSS